MKSMIPLLLLLATAPLHAQTRSELRASLQRLAPYLEIAWELPLRDVRVRSLWADGTDVLVESEGHRLWAIEQKTGRTRFAFAQRIGSSRRTFRIERRPVRSARRLYLTGGGYLFVLDHAGNLESYAALDFVPASDAAATDELLLCGTEGRFFYGYDHRDKQYRARRRLDGRAAARPAIGGGRVYFAAGKRVSALSISGGRFFGTVWSKPVYDEVSAPLALHPGAARLYAAGENGTLFSYNTHSGEIRWSCETGGTIRRQPVGRGDAVYVVAEDGEQRGLWCIAAIDPRGGTEGSARWRFDRGKELLAAGKRLYVRTARGIAVLRAGDGKLLAERAIDAPFIAGAGAEIFAGTRDGLLFALREKGS